MTTVNNQSLIEKFEEIDDNVTVLKDGVYSLRRDVSEVKENMVTKDFLRKELSKYPDKEYLDKKLDNYPTKIYLDTKLENYPTKAYLDRKLENYPTKDDLNRALKNQSEMIIGVIKEAIKELRTA